MLNPNGPAIEYAALTKLVDLAEQVAEQNKRSRNVAPLARAAKIRYFLKALDDKEYLSDLQINRIWQCLTQLAELNEIPSGLALAERPAPAIAVGPVGPAGPQGIPGQDGFGTDFAALNISTNTIVDTFPLSSAMACRWYYLLESVSGIREGTVHAVWSSDGLNITYYETGSLDLIGSTSAVDLVVTIVGSDVRLTANVSGGTWNLRGTRYYTPGNGSGTGPVNAVLPSAQVFVGNASNIATPQVLTGAVSVDNAGVVSINANYITNTHINGAAGIAVNKLAPLTASRIVVTDINGFLTSSAFTTSQLVGGAGNTSRVTFWSNVNTLTSSSNFTYDSGTNTLSVVNILGTSGLNLSAFGAPIVSTVRHEFSPTSSNSGLRLGTISANPSSLGNSDVWYNSTTHTVNARINGATESFVTSIDSTKALKVKVIDIGDWNMDTTGSVTVTHGISPITRVRTVAATVRRDDDAFLFDIVGSADANVSNVTPAVVTLTRTAAGFFDSTNFDATGFNRGWVTITYEG